MRETGAKRRRKGTVVRDIEAAKRKMETSKREIEADKKRETGYFGGL